MDLLLILAWLVGIVATGFVVAMWIFRGEDAVAAECWLPVSFALGLGVQAFVFLVTIVVTGFYWVPLFWAVAVLLGVATWWWRGRAAPLGVFRGLDALAGPQDAAHRSLYVAAVVGIMFFLGVLYFNALSYPMAGYDSRAIWNYKARLLFHEGTPFGDSFLHPDRVHYHREYPLMVPLSKVGLYSALGREDPDKVRFLYSSMMLFFAMWLYWAVRQRTGRMVAMGVALVFAGLPFREDWVIRDAGGINSGEADFPMAFYATLAVVGYWRWWETGRRPWLLLAGAFTGCALMIKNEGLVLLATLGGANVLQWVVGAGGERWPRLRQLALSWGLTLAVALPMIVVGRSLPLMYDEDYFDAMEPERLAESYRRLPTIWAIFENDVTEVEKWSYGWFLYPVVLLAAVPLLVARRRVFLVAVVALWLTAYTFVYLVSPLNLIFHLNTSLRRLLAHVYPVVLLSIILYGSMVWDWSKGGKSQT